MSEARDGSVELDAAVAIEEQRVDGLPHGHVDVVRGGLLNDGESIRPHDLELREGAQIEQGDALARSPMLGGNLLEPAGLAVAVPLGRGHAAVPVRALAAVDLAEARA